jgi:hypothetical protein
MIRKSSLWLAPFVVLFGCSDQPTAVEPLADDLAIQASKTAIGGRAHGALGAVYVRSQGLYYDTFVSAETLPPHGRFQALEDGETDYGPGDPGYLGGRWWVDANGDGIQNEGDMYLLCPLLPPGRTEP